LIAWHCLQFALNTDSPAAASPPEASAAGAADTVAGAVAVESANPFGPSKKEMRKTKEKAEILI
jgi:hypothetical protein